MRSSVITGSLVVSVGALLLLPALSERSEPPSAVASTRASEAPRVPSVARPFPSGLIPAAEAARRGAWEDTLRHLARVEPSTPRDRALQLTLQAAALLRVNEIEQADAAATRAMAEAEKAKDASLAARAAFLRAEARAAGSDHAQAAAAFQAAAASGMPGLRREAAMRGAEVWIATDAAGALASLRPLAERPGASARVLADAARAAEATGDLELARRFLRQVRADWPTSAEAKAASSHALMASEAAIALKEGRVEELLGRLDALVEADDAKSALPDIQFLLQQEVPANLRARLELIAGRAHRVAGHPATALPLLVRAMRDDGPIGCRAALHASKAAASLRRAGDAKAYLARAARGCACEWSDRAGFERAEASARAGDAADAAAALTRLATAGSTPATRARAGFGLAFRAMLDGKTDIARAGFEAIVRDSATAREASGAGYWLARILAASGDEAAAAERYALVAATFPREWYGLLAAEAIGSELPPLPPCDDAAQSADLARLALAVMGEPEGAADLLDVEALGLVEATLLEIDAGTGPAADRSGMKAMVLSRAGRSREALREFRRHVPDWRQRADVSPGLACAAWPVHHENLVLEMSGAAGLDPALVFGLIHQESVFDDRAISRAGARGLMQVMPATGRVIAQWLGERVTTDRLTEPRTNVRYGTTYLRRLLDESGRREVALAGYNAGPGRAKRWWAATPDADLALFVESIPFDETRDYVKAVSVNERLYRGRFTAPAVAGQ